MVRDFCVEGARLYNGHALAECLINLFPYTWVYPPLTSGSSGNLHPGVQTVYIRMEALLLKYA